MSVDLKRSGSPRISHRAESPWDQPVIGGCAQMGWVKGWGEGVFDGQRGKGGLRVGLDGSGMD